MRLSLHFGEAWRRRQPREHDKSGSWRHGSGRGEFSDLETFPCLELAFTPKPVLHSGLEAVEGDAVPSFQQSINNRKRVVEDRIVRKVAHSKVVDPVDRAGMALACGVDALDGESADEHGSTLTDAWDWTSLLDQANNPGSPDSRLFLAAHSDFALQWIHECACNRQPGAHPGRNGQDSRTKF